MHPFLPGKMHFIVRPHIFPSARRCCRTISVKDSLSIEWIEATGFQPVRFSERMRGLPDFEASPFGRLQNPGDPS